MGVVVLVLLLIRHWAQDDDPPHPRFVIGNRKQASRGVGRRDEAVMRLQMVALAFVFGSTPSARAEIGAHVSMDTSVLEVSDLDECTQRVRDAPQEYGSARCFLLLARRAPEQLTEVAQQLYTLQLSLPEYPFLSIVAGELVARRDPAWARARFEDARLKFLLSGHEDGVVIAESRLYFSYRTSLDHAQAEAYLDRLHEHVHHAKDPIARQRAAVAWARSHLIRQVDLGLAAQYLAKYDGLLTIDLPYFLREQFCKTSALALSRFRRYRLARARYREVEGIARAHKDFRTVALVKFYLALSHMMELEAEPSLEGRFVAEREIRSALVIAEQYGAQALVNASQKNLFWLLGGDPARREEAKALAEDALTQAIELGFPKSIATSYVAKSQVLLETDPELALNLASFSVSQGGTQQDPLASLGAWRQLGRSLLRLLPASEAKWAAMVLVERIEDQRTEQNQKRARRELFAARMSDYDWAMGQLLSSSQAQDHALAFQLLERSRARGLADRWVLGVDGQTPAPLAVAQRDFYLESSYPPGLVQAYYRPKLEAMERWVRERIAGRGDLRIPQIQAALRPDQAMLAFHVVPPKTVDGDVLGPSHVFVITRKRWFVLPLELRPVKLRSQLSIYRSAVEDRAGFAAAIQSELRRQVLAPIFEELPASIRKLVVVADEPLPFLSFGGVDPDHQWTRTPSAGAWLRTRRNKDVLHSLKALVVVNPHLSDEGHLAPPDQDGDPKPSAAIPFSRREVDTIKEALPGAKVVALSGKDATYARLRSAWTEGLNLLHVSSHTQWVPGAPDMTSIALAQGPNGEDSAWTLAAIESQNYDGAVVVLGGCATAFGPSVPGEGTLSLADAFLSAGASAVLGSLWPVRDEEASRFLDFFYRQWGAGHTLGQALFNTQTHFRAAGEAPAMYSGYVVSGNAQLRALSPPRSR